MTRERRYFGRVPQAFEVKYRPPGQLMEHWRAVTTLNLSAGGMRFRDRDLLEAGVELEVQIKLPSDPQPLLLRARVAWSQLEASGVSENGVAFIGVTTEQQVRIDRLVQFLKKSA